MDIVELIRNVITALAAGTGATVAVVGLRTWRKQLRGKTEYELARRLLRAALKVRDELAYVRGPFISAGEIAAAVEESGTDVDMPSEEAGEIARARRWKYLTDALSDFELEALEAEVIWGGEITTQLSALRECVRRLRGASWEYGFLQNSGSPFKKDERQRLVELRRVVFGSSGESDGFAAEVQEAISGIEAHLRPHLEI